MSNEDLTAVERLARIADRLAARKLAPRRFLRGLAWNAAGIRPSVRGYLDLARGGRNPVPGGGFRTRFDDGTGGQVRHFAGIAVSPVLLGERVARLAQRLALGDAPQTADGRLTEAALRFSAAIRDGSLPPTEAGDWIREHLAD